MMGKVGKTILKLWSMTSLLVDVSLLLSCIFWPHVSCAEHQSRFASAPANLSIHSYTTISIKSPSSPNQNTIFLASEQTQHLNLPIQAALSQSTLYYNYNYPVLHVQDGKLRRPRSAVPKPSCTS